MRSLSRRSIPVMALLLAGALGACQTPPTSSAQDFVAAANALAQAESDYFDQIQAASDESLRLTNEALYAGAKVPWTVLAPRLSSHNDFSQAKALRMAMIGQLQNYTQQVALIATAGTDSSLTAAVNSTISDVSNLAKAENALKITPAQLTLVETAVTDLGNAIIANEAARELQSLAQQATKPIADISTVTDADRDIFENTNYAPELQSDQHAAITAILEIVYTSKQLSPLDRLAIYNQFTTTWKPVLVTKGRDVAGAMKKLQAANEAMKANHPVAASVLAQAAIQLATQAIETQPIKK
jgi:hypothetical protein